jgi:hypothetical protein
MAGYLDFLKELRNAVYTKSDNLNCFEIHGCDVAKKEKNHVNKNQGWEPIEQMYKANENKSRHNPKKKNQR